MSIYVVLLQGVNVGKHKRIRMADLKQIVIALDGENPITVANSGNVVFAYDGDLDAGQLRSALEQVIGDHVGQPVPIVIRTDAELREVIANNPYPNESDPTCLHVEFLNEPVANALEGIAFGEDHLTAVGREIYLHAPNKMSGITYDARALGKRLVTRHTSRNWNTISNLDDVIARLTR